MYIQRNAPVKFVMREEADEYVMRPCKGKILNPAGKGYLKTEAPIHDIGQWQAQQQAIVVSRGCFTGITEADLQPIEQWPCGLTVQALVLAPALSSKVSSRRFNSFGNCSSRENKAVLRGVTAIRSYSKRRNVQPHAILSQGEELPGGDPFPIKIKIKIPQIPTPPPTPNSFHTLPQ